MISGLIAECAKFFIDVYQDMLSKLIELFLHSVLPTIGRINPKEAKPHIHCDQRSIFHDVAASNLVNEKGLKTAS